VTDRASRVRRPIRVVNVLPLTDAATSRLSSLAPDLEIVHHVTTDPRWAREHLVDPDVEVLFSSHPPADLSRTPRLRWLQLGVAGVEHLDLAGLRRAGISVSNASGIHAVPIAEYVVGMLLHIAKGVEERQASQAVRDWPRDARLVGRLLRGQTIVIVGYGNVGQEIGRLAHELGMRVLAVKASPAGRRRARFRLAGTGDPGGRLPQRVVGPADLAGVARDVDYVVVTTPATPATRGLVSASVLGAMRPSAWLINVGRGTCVDGSALEAALRARAIGGAVLDVFEEEPLPVDSPFWELPNCIVTPHISGGPPGAFDLLSDLLVENLTRYLEARPLLNVVSARRGY
jgi:phosphoglycerate dehydrogenase-like enzyme